MADTQHWRAIIYLKVTDPAEKMGYSATDYDLSA